MNEYTLPELPYDYAALEPNISARIMELHHDKHHATYVAGANTALAQMAEAREKGDFATIPKLSKDLAFHVGGHVNHSIFWNNLSPKAATSRLASLLQPSTTSSVPSMRSAASSPPRPRRCRAPAGHSWPTSRWERTLLSSSCTTSRATSPLAPFRC